MFVDDTERRRESLLALTLGEVRGRAFAMLEAWSVFVHYRLDLCSLWVYALRAVEYEKESWPIHEAVFGSLEDWVASLSTPVSLEGCPAAYLAGLKEKERERRAIWAEVEAAAIEGGVDSLLESYWAGVPLEDLLV